MSHVRCDLFVLLPVARDDTIAPVTTMAEANHSISTFLSTGKLSVFLLTKISMI